MKSVGHELYSGHSFQQLPIPNEIHPPFKPISDFSNLPFESELSQYGPPSHYQDYSGHASQNTAFAVSPPRAYDIYHKMQMKAKREKNFVTLQTPVDNRPGTFHPGLEIQKSIQYEISAWSENHYLE